MVSTNTTKKKSSSKKGGRVPNPPKNAAFASDYGSRLGANLGEGVQSLFNWFGAGDYTLKHNSLVDTMRLTPSGPSVRKNTDGSVTIRHSEYFGDLLTGLNTGTGTPSSFSSRPYAITPTNRTLFPWLSQWAGLFQEFEFNGLIFQFRSETSDFSQSSFLGSVFSVVDYDSSPTEYNTKQSILDSFWGMSVKPSCDMVAPVECARSKDVATHRYVPPSGIVPTGYDPRLYSLGNMWIGSYGLPMSASPCGEMWIHYEVTLFKPVLESGFNGLSFHAGFLAPFAPGAVSPSPYPVPVYDAVSKSIAKIEFLPAPNCFRVVLDPSISGDWLVRVEAWVPANSAATGLNVGLAGVSAGKKLAPSTSGPSTATATRSEVIASANPQNAYRVDYISVPATNLMTGTSGTLTYTLSAAFNASNPMSVNFDVTAFPLNKLL